MSANNQVQCHLRYVDPETGVNTHLHAWIPERGAKVGNRVELPATGRTWEVVGVGVSMGEQQLKKHQADHRKSLVSVEPMAPPKGVGTL